MFLSRSCKECHRNIRAVEHKKYLGKGSYRENLSAHGRLTEPTCLRLPANFRVFRPWSRTAELCVDFNPEQHEAPLECVAYTSKQSNFKSMQWCQVLPTWRHYTDPSSGAP